MGVAVVDAVLEIDASIEGVFIEGVFIEGVLIEAALMDDKLIAFKGCVLVKLDSFLVSVGIVGAGVNDVDVGVDVIGAAVDKGMETAVAGSTSGALVFEFAFLATSDSDLISGAVLNAATFCVSLSADRVVA